MEIEVKNRFALGDRIECVLPASNRIQAIGRMENAAGEATAVAPGNGHRVWIDLPPETIGAYVARFL
jgi:putative protease